MVASSLPNTCLAAAVLEVYVVASSLPNACLAAALLEV